MRIGRTRDGVLVVDGTRRKWRALTSLGISARDTRDVIEQHSLISAALTEDSSGEALDDVDFISPVFRPGKILAIGLNYLDHIRETGADQPERPIVFAKYPSSLNGPFDPVVVDKRLTSQADYEAELAVIIGKGGRWLDPDSALDAVFGYAVANDVSARDWQRKDSQFSRSKSMDTFCPLGPWITTADEVPDPQRLRISCQVNGETRQSSNTSEMLFTIADLLVYLSRSMTLEPGDVLLTGTPPGVGVAMEPPRFLQPGDRVRCEIEGLGAIDNPIVDAKGTK